MKKILFGVAALGLLGLAGAGVGLKAQNTVEAKADGERIIYLKTNSNWESDGARFACNFFNETTSTWRDCVETGEDNEYSVVVPEDYLTATAIFCRMKAGTTENNWENMWNQTSNLPIADGNYATITGWSYSQTWRENSIASGVYLRGDWDKGWSYSGQLAMTADGDDYVIEDLILNDGSKIKAVNYNDHECTWPDIAEVTGDAAKSGLDIVVSGSGIYTVRVSWDDASLNYTVTKTADEALATAITFAKSFNDDLSTVCQLDGSTDFDDLNAAWTAKSDAYDLIKGNDGVTSYLRGATTSSSSSVLATFAGKYDHILKATVARGEALTKGDFLGRSAAAYNIAGFNGKTGDVTPWVAGGITAIALSIFGAFIIHKRRAE